MAVTTFVKTLFESPTLRITDIRWRAHNGAITGEYASPLGEITFQRRGMFVKHHGPARAACDPNTLIFINPGEPYRMSHPGPLDCACTALLLTPEALSEIVGEFLPAARERRAAPFRFPDCPASSAFDVAHRKLYQLARQADALEPLAIEEAGIGLARQAVAAAVRFHAARPRPVRGPTSRCHQDLAQAVKELLAARLDAGVSLHDLAKSVHCAPTHLCRIFKQTTGLPIHQYLNRLRLTAALDYLEDPRANLAHLAVALGFTHHSHFTRLFTRTFGVPPSEFRRRLHSEERREIRKILQA